MMLLLSFLSVSGFWKEPWCRLVSSSWCVIS